MCSKYMCSLIKDTYEIGENTILRARRIDLIPQSGKLKEGYKFSFHGGGCFFEFENGAIDIDFGPENRCDGFDSFRLYNFLVNSKSGEYPYLQSEEAIRKELIRLLDEGIIIHPNSYPNPHLFYLSDLSSGNVSD